MSASTGNTPLNKKLGLHGDIVFTLVGAPRGFEQALGDVGEAVHQRNLMPTIDVVVSFFTERERMKAKWPQLADAAAPAGEVWVAWPKKNSGVNTDLTEDIVRADMMKAGWLDNKLASIDDTWSALRFVMRRDTRPPWKR